MTSPLPRLPRLAGWRAQVALFAAAYLAYGLARWVATGDTGRAVDHAHWIVDLQRRLGLDVEHGVQRALDGAVVIDALNYLYLAAQLVVVPAALVWLYRSSLAGFRLLRDTVLITWLLSVPVYSLFPVAPPRLADIGIVDTITTHAGFALDSHLTTKLFNPLAAVPSLHAGFALAVGVAALRHARTPLGRAFGAAWPPLVAVAVVATGNHFVFDVVAGYAITVLGLGLALAVQRMGLRRPAVPRLERGCPGRAHPAGHPA